MSDEAKIMLKDMQIEGMKKEIISQDQFIARLEKEYGTEIERLNNIISELEKKMLNDKLYIENISKKQPYPIEEFRIRNPYTTGFYDSCVNYLGKIKELKGSESNE